jgi:hypothetical protein
VNEGSGYHPATDCLAEFVGVIDLLIASGLSEEVAAQTVGQRMIAARIPLPKDAGECILAWRTAFRDGVATDEAFKEYRNVVAAIELILPLERVECVLENELWNRRRTILRRPPETGCQLC